LRSRENYIPILPPLNAEVMPFKEAHRVLELYPSLSIRDKLAILARLVFCTRPIMTVLDQYLPRHGLILDPGCGYGIISHLVSSACPERRVTGVDASSRRIEVAKSSVNSRKNLEFHAADIMSFRIPHCNAIMMIDILQMLPHSEQEKLLIRCHERLCDGGVVIIKDNCKSPLWKYVYTCIEEAIKVKLGVYGKEFKGCSLHCWDTQEFLKLLSSIGFDAAMITLRSHFPYPGVFYVCRKPAR